MAVTNTSDWIERMKHLSDDSLQELVSNMQQVLSQWTVGEKADFQLRLDLARDEQARRKKAIAEKRQNPGSPGP